MRKTLRFFLAGGLVALSAWLGLRADPPAARTSGHVLLLENDRALEGDIQREGNQYRIRRDIGEVWIPAARARCLCADWNEAYEVVRRQANLHDVDERLRLARWCALHNLREQGLAEVQAVLKQRPQHQEAKQLANMFQRGLQAPPPALPAQAAELTPARPAVDLSADALAVFNTRVQPILMNACAGCHATGRGGDFKLLRCYDGQLNRKATQENLAAVLTHLRHDQPEISPLLVKSVSLHGNAGQAPLPGRASVPYKTLTEWVAQVVAGNPHLRKETVTPVAAVVSRPPALAPAEAPPPRLLPTLEPKAPPVTEFAPAVRVQPERPAATAPADEFDPALFNRQMHPGRVH